MTVVVVSPARLPQVVVRRREPVPEQPAAVQRAEPVPVRRAVVVTVPAAAGRRTG